jgi:hypothetical protein
MTQPRTHSAVLTPRADGQSVLAPPYDVIRMLVDVLAPAVGTPVDEQHVAAVLESRGVTDVVARDKYGHSDVFALAAAMLPRLPAAPAPAAERPPRAGVLRSLSHGPLYLAASLVYPAVFAALGQAGMLRALVCATGIGWVWGVGMSSVAYQLRSLHRDAESGPVQHLLLWLGVVLALAVSLALALTGAGGAGLVAFVVAQTAFQLAAVVLLFHKRERGLALGMLPAAVAGALYLLFGQPTQLVVPTLVAAAVSVGLVVAAAVRRTGPAQLVRARAVLGSLGPAQRGVWTSVGYAAACAALLLGVDTRYLDGPSDLATAAVPLVVGMGAIELRANRFFEQARSLLDQDRLTGQIRTDVWRLMLRELSTVAAILGVLALALLLIMTGLGVLTTGGAVLVDGHVVLGCVLFLGFVLARSRWFPRVLSALAVAALAYLALIPWAAAWRPPLGGVLLFVTVSAVLLACFVAAFRAGTARLRDYYW